MNMKPLAIVAGAGAGLGQSVLQRFEQGGFVVVGLGRSAPPHPAGEFHSLDLSEAVSVAATLAGGGAKFAAFASAKFALRGLTQSLAREYQPQGVHVCHTILDGIIDTDRSRELHSLDPAKMMKPEDIAQAYWQLAHQPKSTWTHELDLRPASEGF